MYSRIGERSEKKDIYPSIMHAQGQYLSNKTSADRTCSCCAIVTLQSSSALHVFHYLPSIYHLAAALLSPRLAFQNNSTSFCSVYLRVTSSTNITDSFRERPPTCKYTCFPQPPSAASFSHAQCECTSWFPCVRHLSAIIPCGAQRRALHARFARTRNTNIHFLPHSVRHAVLGGSGVTRSVSRAPSPNSSLCSGTVLQQSAYLQVDSCSFLLLCNLHPDIGTIYPAPA